MQSKHAVSTPAGGGPIRTLEVGEPFHLAASLDVYEEFFYSDIPNATNASYCGAQSFAQMDGWTEMVNLTDNIKKCVLRPGTGVETMHNSTVVISFRANMENQAQPFETTYTDIRRQCTFTLGKGTMNAEVEIAVKSMKRGERGLFLFRPVEIFDMHGVRSYTPPNTRILLEVELHTFVDVATITSFHWLSVEEQRNFPIIKNFAYAMLRKGDDLCVRKDHVNALAAYELALTHLEPCETNPEEETRQKNNLLVEINASLALCLLELDLYDRCSTLCARIYLLCRDANIGVPPRVYYYHSSSLASLGELDAADERLFQAFSSNNEKMAQHRHLVMLKAFSHFYKDTFIEDVQLVESSDEDD